MEYHLRNCKNDDLSALVELCQKHAEYEKAIYNPIGKIALLEKALFSEDPKLFCLVVESNAEVVGYASYTFDFSTWDAQKFLYLDCLYLEPEFRGFKIGEVIFKSLIEIAKKEKCINIQWQTPSFNEKAIKFYNRIGGIGKDKVRFFLELQTT